MFKKSDQKKLLSRWRASCPRKAFPEFSYRVPGPPEVLVLLESPGPEVQHTHEVSIFNPDRTAAELKRLLEMPFGEFKRETAPPILLWNAVPWFLDHNINATDITEAKPFHDDLLRIIKPNLKCVLLLGKWARDLLPYFSPRVGKARIFGGHHTGGKAQRNHRVKENEAVFSLLRCRDKW